MKDVAPVLGAFRSGLATHIAPRLWQGGFPLVPMTVAASGFDMIVLCAEELQPDKVPCNFSGCVVVCAPLDDTDEPDKVPGIVEAAANAANVVVDALGRGQRVLVTCAKGRNRSGLVVALVLVAHLRISGREARERVQTLRPNALTNGAFAAFLDKVPPGGG